jgi:hypothetical protein
VVSAPVAAEAVLLVGFAPAAAEAMWAGARQEAFAPAVEALCSGEFVPAAAVTAPQAAFGPVAAGVYRAAAVRAAAAERAMSATAVVAPY